METIQVQQAKKIIGDIEVPADKSISHRAVMLGAIAEGESVIENFLMADDCIRTIEAFRAMGIEITQLQPNGRGGGTLLVNGKGLYGPKRPSSSLYLGNSGTTMRLLLGILAGNPFEVALTGDDSLSKRPMKRVTAPLKAMGAEITGTDDANFAPLTIKGKRPLLALEYSMPIPSAQVKSAILFAGLYADGMTKVREAAKSRDHSERMLKLFGADIKVNEGEICISCSLRLEAENIKVPGDISSAAFFIAAAAALPGSSLLVRNVGLNPTRTGIIDALREMGAKIEIFNLRDEEHEPVGDLEVRGSHLHGTALEGEIIPRLIDELPIIMVLAACADGRTLIRGAKELRVKETDRINSMSLSLRKLGAEIEPLEDGVVIEGKKSLAGNRVVSFGDHRTAMSMAVAGLIAGGSTTIEDTRCVATSFPGFEKLLRSVAINV